jgi:Cu-Zn family superoxide dismutase
MSRGNPRPSFVALAAIVLCSGCGSSGVPYYAIALIRPTGGNKCSGVVRFEETAHGVKVIANVEGLSPDGTHGIHIHEFGDISALDAMSAGGHYNPEDNPHAGPDSRPRHAGDLGNLYADSSGVAHYEREVLSLSIAGTLNPIIGRAVIVHRDADDLTSQPTGNAGPRIGAGVIGVAKPRY